MYLSGEEISVQERQCIIQSDLAFILNSPIKFSYSFPQVSLSILFMKSFITSASTSLKTCVFPLVNLWRINIWFNSIINYALFIFISLWRDKRVEYIPKTVFSKIICLHSARTDFCRVTTAHIRLCMKLIDTIDLACNDQRH